MMNCTLDRGAFKGLRNTAAAIIAAFLSLPCIVSTAAAAAPKWRVGEYVIGTVTTSAAQVLGSGKNGVEVTPSVKGARVVRSLQNGNHVVRSTTEAATLSGSNSDIYDPSTDTFCEKILASNPGKITSCSPNYILHTRAVPNDSNFGDLWGMRGANGIDAPSAWDITTGSSSVVVAVIDSGIDYTHPDLAANVWHNPAEVAGNGVDDDGNGYVDDVYGINAINGSGNPFDDNSHGTHCAGTIGGVGNNNRGVAGVNWQVKIMGLKFIGSNGSGALSDAIEAINYMVAMKNRGVNIRVASNSWGGGGFSQPLRDAIARANSAGIVFLAAAGNEANDNDLNPAYPASYDVPNVVSVAATDSEGNLASFSNFGASSVGIAAPGVDILSTIPGNKYAKYSGTSMATPHVAGALALLFANEPGLSVAQAIERLYLTGRDLPSLNGVVRTGRLLNVNRMVRNETAPIADQPGSTCQYSMGTLSYNPDTRADNSDVAISSDEYGYYTVNLPFDFPFYGATTRSIVVSPNGVVYTKSAPSGMDYSNASTAPANSIAALHTDLYPVGGSNGVRVATASDRVTINWTAPTYALREGAAVVRLTLFSSGVIEDWIEFSSSEIQSAISSKATIGIRGQTASSATTFASNSDAIISGLGLRFTPSCGGSGDNGGGESVNVSEINISGRSASGMAMNRILRGGMFDLSAYGSGTSSLAFNFILNGRRCNQRATVPFNGGAAKVYGKVPSQVPAGQTLKVTVEGFSPQKRIGIVDRKTRSRTRSNRSRLSLRNFKSVCKSLVSSVK